MATVHVYAADIVKTARTSDGDLEVYGKATGPDLDLDRQVCDPAWLAKAMPDWFATGGNIREQHSQIAAGVATDLEKAGESWMVRSLVVDPTSARKVETGVLKGYSVGISNPRIVKDATAPGGRIVDGQIIEVSLVDRPANPTCTLTLAKAAQPGELVDPADFDQARGLVRVEDLVEKAVDADGNVDEQPEIDGAREALAIIGRLIAGESQEIAAGRFDETYDVDLLLRAAECIKAFLRCEQYTAVEQADDTEVTEVMLSAGATKITTSTTEGSARERDLATLVKTAVTEAVSAHEQRVKALEAELAKVKATPIPGGPVLTRTTQDTTKAGRREDLLTKAADYRNLALQFVSDPQARASYEQLAAEAEAQAATIV